MELTPRSAGKVYISLSNAGGEEVVMCYDSRARTFGMDRTHSGQTDFSKDFPVTIVAPCPVGESLKLRLFLDRCSLEAFEAEGRMAMTHLLFPARPYDTMTVYTDGGRCRVSGLTVYPLQVGRSVDKDK